MTSPLIEVDASTLAGTWNVAFRPESPGFSAWVTIGSGFPNPVRSHLIKESLNWRLAAEILADLYEDGLEGDWINSIEVTGASGWQAEILKMSAVTMANPYYDQLQLLMELDEVEIESIFNQFGTLLSTEAKQYVLEHFGEAACEVVDAKDHRTVTENYSDLEAITAFDCPSDPEDIVDLLIRWAAADKKPTRNLSSNVSWPNERTWFMWLFYASPIDLLVTCAKKHIETATAIAAWLRLKTEESNCRIEYLRKYGNQASQIEIGIHRSFLTAAMERLVAYDKHE